MGKRKSSAADDATENPKQGKSAELTASPSKAKGKSAKKQSYAIEGLCSYLPSQKTTFEAYNRQYPPGTGDHFLNAPEFQSWVDGSLKNLGCCGLPGSGKTTMATIAINYLKTASESGQRIIPLYLLCDYDAFDPKDMFTFVMASLLGQLLQACGYYVGDGEDYDERENIANFSFTAGRFPQYLHDVARRFPNRSPPLRTNLQDFLISQLHGHGRTGVRIVLDISGEPSSGSDAVQQLVKNLESFDLPLLTFSRYDVYFSQPELAARLRAEASAGDIRQYIKNRLTQGCWATVLDRQNGLQDEIVDVVTTNSHGIFHTALLQVSFLQEIRTVEGIREALSSLPTCGLSATYEALLKRISTRNAHRRKVAFAILAWLLLSKEFMTGEMLLNALASTVESAASDKLELTDEDVIGFCEGFVIKKTVYGLCIPVLGSELITAWYPHRLEVQNKIYTYFTFARISEKSGSHADSSMKEFLLCNHKLLAEWIPSAKIEIVNSCLRYIATANPDEPRSDMFLSYAIRHWGEHARDADEEFDFRLAASSFEQFSTRIPDHRLDKWRLFETTYPGALVSFDLYKALSHYVQSLPNHENQLTDLLSKAISANNCRIASLLLQQGIVLDRSDAYLYNPALKGNVDLVVLLLKHEANPNVVADQSGHTPLYAAVANNHREVVALLLQEGANPNSFFSYNNTNFDRFTGTPLSLAVYRNDVETVEILLKSKANPELCGHKQTLLLSYACERQSIRLIRALLENGANPNTDPHRDDGHTPLITAVRRKDLDIVQLLLQHGANPDAIDYHNRTPLSHASELGFAPVVALLLAKGVKIDSGCFWMNSFSPQLKMSGRCIRPLDIAKRHGHNEVAEMLKEAGAQDEDQPNGRYDLHPDSKYLRSI